MGVFFTDFSLHQIFIGHLFYERHCSSLLGYATEQNSKSPSPPVASVLGVRTLVTLRETGRFRLQDQSKKVKKLFKDFLKSRCIPLIPYVCNDRNKAYSGLSQRSELESF